jgi:hypothetical protein
MLNLPDDFRDLIQILSRNGVQYMIVGGYALSLYAAPRTTGDIDIFVKIDPENAKRILHSLNEFGFGDLDISEQDLLSPAQVIQLGFPPNRVDFMTTIEGVSWEEAFANRKQVIQDGLTFPVIGKEELVKNKLSTGRLKDMADVEQVRKKDKKNPQNSSEG